MTSNRRNHTVHFLAFARYGAAVLCSFIAPLIPGTAHCGNSDTLYTMQYVLNGRFILDMSAFNKMIAKSQSAQQEQKKPVSGAQEYLTGQGVTFPPGAAANLIQTKNLLIIKNTRNNILLVETIIDQSNQQNGLNPKVNKHLADLFPIQQESPQKNVTTNAIQAISSEAQGSGVGMHIDSIEVNNQIFNVFSGEGRNPPTLVGDFNRVEKWKTTKAAAIRDTT